MSTSVFFSAAANATNTAYATTTIAAVTMGSSRSVRQRMRETNTQPCSPPPLPDAASFMAEDAKEQVASAIAIAMGSSPSVQQVMRETNTQLPAYSPPLLPVVAEEDDAISFIKDDYDKENKEQQRDTTRPRSHRGIQLRQQRSHSKFIKEALTKIHGDLQSVLSDVTELRSRTQQMQGELESIHSDFGKQQKVLADVREQGVDFIGKTGERLARKQAAKMGGFFSTKSQRRAIKYSTIWGIARHLLGLTIDEEDLKNKIVSKLYPLILQRDNMTNTLMQVLKQCLTLLGAWRTEGDMKDVLAIKLKVQEISAAMKIKSTTWEVINKKLAKARSRVPSSCNTNVGAELKFLLSSLDDVLVHMDHVLVGEDTDIELLQERVDVKSNSTFVLLVQYAAKRLRTNLEVDLRGGSSLEGSVFQVEFGEAKYSWDLKVSSKAKDQVQVTVNVYRTLIQALYPEYVFKYKAFIFVVLLDDEEATEICDECGKMCMVSSGEP